MDTWFQEGQPASYKIQIMYVELPPEIARTLKRRPVDTPFRFRSYQEALNTAAQMFPEHEVKIVGSQDTPHWQAPEGRKTLEDINKSNWYDVYGIRPTYKVQTSDAARTKVLADLAALKPAQETVFSSASRGQGKQRP